MQTNSPTGYPAFKSLLSACLLTAALSWAPFSLAEPPAKVDAARLRIAYDVHSNPEVSFTNKRSAFYQTQTNVNDHPEHAWFRGFNIAGRRIFQDLIVTLDGRTLDPAQSKGGFTPVALHRVYPRGEYEMLYPADNADALIVQLVASDSVPVIELRGDNLTRVADNLYSVRQADGLTDFVSVATGKAKAVIAVGKSHADATQLARNTLAAGDTPLYMRMLRLDRLLNGDHYLEAGDATDELRWMTLSLDA